MNDREYLSVERAERRYAHGTRAHYSLAKWRCFPCKVANADYETARQADRRQPFRMRCVGGGRIWQVRRTDTGEVVFSTSERSIAKRRRDSLNRRTEPPQPDNELISTGEVIAHVEALVAAWRRSSGSGDCRRDQPWGQAAYCSRKYPEDSARDR